MSLFLLGFRPGCFRYISEHIEPMSFRRDFFSISHLDLTPSDRLYCFPPPGSVRAAVSKLLHLGASGVLVAFEGEVAAIPELRQRDEEPAAGGGGGATGPESPRAWERRADGRVRGGVGPWFSLSKHAGWWPLATGQWAERKESEPPTVGDIWRGEHRGPGASAAKAHSTTNSSSSSGGGQGAALGGGERGPGQLVAIFFAFPKQQQQSSPPPPQQ